MGAGVTEKIMDNAFLVGIDKKQETPLTASISLKKSFYYCMNIIFVHHANKLSTYESKPKLFLWLLRHFTLLIARA